jgi:hypothetical protein
VGGQRCSLETEVQDEQSGLEVGDQVRCSRFCYIVLLCWMGWMELFVLINRGLWYK